MTQVNLLEAKHRLSELIKAAVAGDEVIIANRGVPAFRGCWPSGRRRG